MAQLIDAGNGSHLWSERYDRDMTDIFAIQDEIGAAISGALKLRLAPRGRKVDIEAWQNYLKGRYYLVHLTPESLAKAREFFQQALDIDPNYAAAYSGLATYHYLLAALGLKPQGEASPLAKAAAEKALYVDPADDWAHTTLGAMAAACDYDWKLAERHYRDAMAVEPVPPLTRNSYAMNFLLPMRRMPEAIEQYRLALETDPLSMVLHFGLAVSMYNAKQYRECIDHARRALEIDPNSYFMRFAMGSAQLSAGLLKDALASLERVVELAPWYKMGVGALAAAYHQAGDRKFGRECANKLAGADGHTVAAAWYYTAVGDADAIFDALNGAVDRRDLFVLYIQTLPFLEPWRGEARFQSVLHRMNLKRAGN
jgi:tetratricopeptide (TPR) repeat protein